MNKFYDQWCIKNWERISRNLYFWSLFATRSEKHRAPGYFQFSFRYFWYLPTAASLGFQSKLVPEVEQTLDIILKNARTLKSHSISRNTSIDLMIDLFFKSLYISVIMLAQILISRYIQNDVLHSMVGQMIKKNPPSPNFKGWCIAILFLRTKINVIHMNKSIYSNESWFRCMQIDFRPQL